MRIVLPNKNLNFDIPTKFTLWTIPPTLGNLKKKRFTHFQTMFCFVCLFVFFFFFPMHINKKKIVLTIENVMA